jgi:hypothetical protein
MVKEYYCRNDYNSKSKNKIRQLYSDALPEFNSKTRKELSTEYLNKT